MTATATRFEFLRCLRCRVSWDFPRDQAGKIDQGPTIALMRSHEAAFPKHRVSMATIEGVTGEKPCTSSCVNATGPDCECSCGGKDHGRFA